MDKPKKLGVALGRLSFYALTSVGTCLMLSASASYLELGDTHPFFLEKLPLARPELWLTALYLHVPSALFCLPACLLLLVARLRRRWPRFHRWLGRLTGVLVLTVVVPSGMYLALFAQGGLLTTSGFWLTGLITFVAMLKSIQSARARNMVAHRRFSTHVVAQLSVAVVSRFMLVAAETAGLDGEWAYIAALWLPVLGSALVAELVAGPRLFSSSSRSARFARQPRRDLAMKSSMPFLVLMLCTGVALAEPPVAPKEKTQATVEALVHNQLVVPLKKAESKRSRFSRATPAPVQRRLRILDEVALTDARGKQFVRFAIDVRRSFNEEGVWRSDDVVGCAYPNEGQLFVQHGAAYFSARIMLGERQKARADVCRAAPGTAAGEGGNA
jgi:uncharacterized membrane protein